MSKNRKNKIFFIQPAYAHYRKRLFKILSARHNIIFIFERPNSNYPSKEAPENYPHIFLKNNFILKYSGLIYYLLTKKPDIVISSTSYSMRSIISYLYAIIFRKKFILWILEWHNRSSHSSLLIHIWRLIKNSIGTHTIRKSNALVVGGTAAKNYAISLNKDLSDIFIAMQSTDDLKERVIKNEFNILNNNKLTFLYLSRIIPRKGLDILLKAFCLLRMKESNVFLVIGGDGPFLSHCKNICLSLKIPDVLFVGVVDQEHVNELYINADVYVLPSNNRDGLEEPWGLVINEAMSMGKPVITTDYVGAAYDYVINGYNGYTVKQNSILHLYEAMDKIIKMDLKKMGEHSRTMFDEKNNFIKMADGFSSAIRSVTEI
jgi:glycosyltransferase involved in cell wall biosynthesis